PKAVTATEQTEVVVERVVLHHQHDDVLDLGDRVGAFRHRRARQRVRSTVLGPGTAAAGEGEDGPGLHEPAARDHRPAIMPRAASSRGMPTDNAAAWDRHSAAYQEGARLPTHVAHYGPDIGTEAD